MDAHFRVCHENLDLPLRPFSNSKAKINSCVFDFLHPSVSRKLYHFDVKILARSNIRNKVKVHETRPQNQRVALHDSFFVWAFGLPGLKPAIFHSVTFRCDSWDVLILQPNLVVNVNDEKTPLIREKDKVLIRVKRDHNPFDIRVELRDHLVKFNCLEKHSVSSEKIDKVLRVLLSHCNDRRFDDQSYMIE